MDSMKTMNKANDFNISEYQNIKEFYRRTNLTRNEATEYLLSKIKELTLELKNIGGYNYE